MFKMYKILFFNTLIMGVLVTVSSQSWMSMWMGLEINLLSIIPLMASPKNMYSSEAALKYFISQALASMILMFSILMMMIMVEFIPPNLNPFLLLLDSSLLIKLGMAPFHFWFPEVMEGLSWGNSSIILTIQKIAPMTMIMNNPMNQLFFSLIIVISLIISTTMSFNQTSLRKILTFSSINHLSWMTALMLQSSPAWTVYLSIYILLNMNIIFMFKMTNSFQFQQMFKMMKNKVLKLSFSINFLSLGGVPPFIGFLPKWLAVNFLVDNKLMFLNFMLIMFTLVLLFVYTQMILSTMVINSTEQAPLINYTPSYIINLANLINLGLIVLAPMMFIIE
uniref:NADH-ubiquinone oxidoreductase chain 2 n=1 Tax=Tenebrionoidea sp. 4 KM-2017 TaxID=2219482 RepID=A0A346RJH4_9CUCU|nr:NADH dehydrogenase subunit 2 [Tenebrionoidea sp. 4 KM-2017]